MNIYNIRDIDNDWKSLWIFKTELSLEMLQAYQCEFKESDDSELEYTTEAFVKYIRDLWIKISYRNDWDLNF